MRESDIQKIKAVLLYILDKMPKDRCDVYHIVKTAFYAQKYHFVRYALPLFKDDITALQFGPVPSLIYNALKVARGQQDAYHFCDKHTLDTLSSAINFKDEFFSAKEKADMESLSKSNIECLDEAILQVKDMAFSELMEATHDKEWHRAYHSSNNHTMDNINIARENGADESTISYLSESLEIDQMIN